MRLILSISLVILIVFQSLSRLFTQLAFDLNKDFISKNLCENRNRPELHCDGKCKLMQAMKFLEERDENKKKSNAPNLKIQEESLYCFDFPSFIQISYYNYKDEKKKTFSHINHFYAAPVAQFFHPPC